jgi:hypothetical protein
MSCGGIYDAPVMVQGLAEDVVVAQLVGALQSLGLKLSEGSKILSHPGWSLHPC